MEGLVKKSWYNTKHNPRRYIAAWQITAGQKHLGVNTNVPRFLAQAK
jgi:hypothetical protein